MKKAFSILILVAFVFCAKAQPNGKIVIGSIDTVFSKVLNEKRTLWIYTPDLTSAADSSGKHYPVLYLLDGEAHFASTVGILHELSQSNGNSVLPEMIVVGITNTDRLRDLTPSNEEGKENPFVTFLETELLPYIEKKYRPAPYRLLSGHSLGGSTAIDILASKPTLFNACLATDPSMWYGNETVLKRIFSTLPGSSLKNTRLFIGIANTVPKGMKLSDLEKDVSKETQHIRSIRKLEKFLDTKHIPGLNYSCQFYQNESHASVPLISQYDGLRFIFDYYLMDITEKDVADSTARIASRYKTHYDRISKEMGYKVAPPEAFINYLGYEALAKKHYGRSDALFKLNIENYPQSNQVYDAYGDFMLAKKDTAKAAESYKKALSIRDYPPTAGKLMAISKTVFSLSEKDLLNYAGDYIITAYKVPLQLQIRNGALWAVVPGQDDSEFVPVSKDRFTVKNMQGYFITFQMEGDKAVGFTSVQPNGTFQITRKP